jgi:hypothetical protein
MVKRSPSEATETTEVVSVVSTTPTLTKEAATAIETKIAEIEVSEEERVVDLMTAEVAMEEVIEAVIEATDVDTPKVWTEASTRISSSAAVIEARWAWVVVLAASARNPTARLYLFQSTQKRPRCRRFSSIPISSE